MDDESSQTLIPIERKGATDLVDPSSTKLKQLELEFEEVKANLQNLADLNESAIRKILDLASRSQNHLVYKALAELMHAANETNRDLAGVLNNKKELYDSMDKNNSPVDDRPNVTNNLHITSSDLIAMLKKKDVPEQG